MKPRRIFSAARLSFPLATALVALFAASHAQAQTRVWNGTVANLANGAWGTAGNWLAADVPDTNVEIASLSNEFTGTAPTFALGANRTVNGVIYEDTGASGDLIGTIVAGSTLTLDGTTPTITTNNSLIINSILSWGATGLTKAAVNTLTLSGVNTGTGPVTLSSGTIRATTSANALGTGAATLSITGASTVLQLANDTGLNFARNTTVGAAATITADRLTAAATSTTHTLGTLSIGANTLSITRGSGITGAGIGGITFGTVTQTGASVFDTAADTTLTLGALQTTAQNITKQGAGTLVLGTAANAARVAGSNILTAGTMRLGSVSALGTTGTTLTLNGGTLDLATDTTVNAHNTTIGGTTTINSNKATAASAGITHTLGTLSIGAFTLNTTRGSNATSGTGAVTFGNATQTGAATFSPQTNSAVTLGGTTALGTFTLNKTGAGSMTMTGVVSGGSTTAGNNSINVTAGALTLSGNNTFSGDVVINGATAVVSMAGGTFTTTNRLGTQAAVYKSVELSNGGTFRLASGDYNVNTPTATNVGAGQVFNIGTGGGTFDVVSGTFTIDDGTGAAGTAWTAPQLQGGGALTKTGVGTLSLGAGSSNFGTAFTGTITVSAGLLQLGNAGSPLGNTTAGTTISSGAALNLNGQTQTAAEPLSLAGTGRAAAPVGALTNSTGTGTWVGPITIASGGATIGGGGGALTLSVGATINTAGNTLTLSHVTGNQTFSGVISGGGNVVVAGSSTGIIVPSAANTYTGGTSLNSGSVAIGIGSTGTAGSPTDGPFGAGSTPLILNGSQLRSGTAGPFTIGNTVTIAANTTFNTVAGEKSLIFSGPVTLSGGSRTLTSNVGTTVAGTSVVFNDAIGDATNALGLIKDGTGNLTLVGANTYTGGTTVNAGALYLTGSLQTGTALTINPTLAGGATLSLTGGAANPLSNISALALGSVTGPTTLALELGAATATSDSINTPIAATTAGTVNIGIMALAGFGSALTYDLITALSGLSGATYALTSAPGGFTYTLASTDSLVQLGVTATTGGDLYWRGNSGSSSWSAISSFNTNWYTTAAGTTNAQANPGAGDTVNFSTVNATNALGGIITTTLDNNFTVNDLVFGSDPNGVTSVTIAGGLTPAGAPGVLAIAPSAASEGVNVGSNAGNVTISSPVILGAAQTWTVDGTGANGSTLTVSGPVTGAGTLDISGLVTLSAAGTSTYNGATTVPSGGILQGGATNSFSASSAVTVNGTGIVRLNGFSNTVATLTGAGTVQNNHASTAATLTVGDATDFTFSGVLQNGGVGTLGLTKTGAGELTLSGANTHTGMTTVNAGTLILGTATTLTSTNNVTLATTGTLDLNGFDQTIGSFTSAATNFITNNAAGTGTNTLNITTAGPTLAALITDGATAKTAIRMNNNLANTKITTNTGNTFSGGLTLAHNVSGGTRLVFGTITGTPWGTGPITIGEANTDRAGIYFDIATQTLPNPIIVNTALGNDRVGIRSDVVGIVLSGQITANLAPVTFSSNGTGAISLTGKVTGSQGLILDSATSGAAITITLGNTAANNDYAGDTVIGQNATAARNRTLQFGAANQIPNGTGTGNVIINSNGTGIGLLSLAGFSDTINGLSGNGLVDSISGTPTLTLGDNDATASFSGVLRNTTSTLNITKIGTGTQTLSGASTFTGTLTVNGGLVAFATSPATAGPLGNTTVVNLSGGGISYTAAGANTLNRTVAIGALDGTVDVASSTGVLSIATVTSTAGNLIKTGSGAAVISGSTTLNSGAAGVSVSSGTLRAGFGTAGVATISVGATGNLDQNNTAVEALTLGNAAGALTLAGGAQVGFELSGATNDSIAVGASGTAVTAGTVTLNFYGTPAAGTYNLLAAPSGLSGAAYTLGVAPNGFNYTINVTDSLVSLTVAAYTPIYWRGGQNFSWNTLGSAPANWTTDGGGVTDATSTPIFSDTVLFSATGAPFTSGTVIDTTLDAAFTVDSLQFTNGPAGVTAVSIAAGSGGSLTLTPASTSGGIRVLTGGGNATISAPLTIGASQTWDVDPTGSLNISGDTVFTGNVLKSNTGALTLSGTNSGSGAITLGGGTLNINSATALGAGVFTIGAGTTINASAGAIALTNNNVQNWNGDFTFTGANTLNMGTGAVTLGSSLTATTSASTLTIGGIIGDGGNNRGLTKAGAGTMILNGANTYTGATAITGGVLRITSNTGLGTNAGGVTQSLNTALEIDGTSGAVSVGAEAFTMGGGGGISNTGAIRNIAGDNTYGGTVTMTTQSRINSDSGTLTLSNPSSVSATNLTLVVGGAGNLTISGAIATGSGGVSKDSAGILTLSGNNTYTGNTAVALGTLNVTGTGSLTGNTSTTRLLLQPTTTGQSAIVNYTSSGTSTFDNVVGASVAGTASVLNQSDGLIQISPNATTDTQSVVTATGAYGVYNISGGTFSDSTGTSGGSRFTLTNIGTASATNGTITGVRVGIVNVSGTGFIDHTNAEWWLNYSLGQINVTGSGKIDHTGSNNPFGLIMNTSVVGGSYGVLNIAGTGAQVLTGNQPLRYGNGTAAADGSGLSAFVNLAAGSLSTGTIGTTSLPAAPSSPNVIHYNYAGGTLKATAALASGWTPTSGASATVTNTIFGPIDNAGVANDFVGGLTVDTNGNAVTIPTTQLLLAATGVGVTQGDLSISGGSGYIGAPSVTFSRPAAATGVAASGYAVISSGAVTEIVITNPGVYASGETPTIILLGGFAAGAGTAATVTATPLATSNTSGGLTKINPGTLTLTGANTYSGATLVSGGVLQLNGAAATTPPATSAITVSTGGTLGFTAATASTLDLGTKDMTLSGGTLAFDIGDAAINDSITVNNFTLSANSAFSFTSIGAIGGTYTLVTSANPITNAGPYTITGQTIGRVTLTPTVNTNTITIGSTVFEGKWNVAGGGNWSLGDPGMTQDNWLNYKPTVAGDAALFGDSIVAPATVAVDTPHIIGYLRFDNANAYTIGANGSSNLVLNNGASNAVVTVTSGSHTIAENVALLSHLDVTPATSTQLTMSGVLSGAKNLEVNGPGTLVLSGANTYTGTTVVSLGKLNITGNTTGTGNVTVGNSAGNAVLNVPTGGSLIGTASGINPTITLGSGGAGSFGALNVTGGTVNLQGTETTDSSSFASSNGGYASFFMSSGSFTQQRFMFGGTGTTTVAGGVGVGMQTGGTVNSTGWMILGRAGASTGVYTITGGTLNHAGAQDIAIGLQGTGRAELNVAGGLINNTGRRVDFSGGTTGSFAWTGTGLLNLNAGALLTNAIFYSSGTAYANFNGGTLRAAATNAAFMNAIPTGGAYVNGAFGAFDGGAVIDTNGFDVTVAAALIAPTGDGVATIPVTSGGSGYIGAPAVSITDGGAGFGATAIANMVDDGTGNGTLEIDSITITNPGNNYTAPSVTLVGGGSGVSAATLGTLTTVANTSGGLTKSGANILTLSGANTYTGLTSVDVGSIDLGNINALGTTAAGTTVASGARVTFGTLATASTVAEAFNIAGTGTATNGALNVGGSKAITLSGAISLSANALISADGGASFNLTNTNSVTGTDTNFTFQTDGSVASSITGIVSLGAGSLTKTGTSTLILSGDNSYSGGTTITGGTLQIGANGTTGTLGSGAVANAGTLVFNRTDTYTLAAGNLVTGAGAVTLANIGSVAATVDGQFNTTGALNFGAANAATLVSALDLTDGSSTFGGATTVRTNSTSANTIEIGAAKTLTLNGGLTVGYSATAGTATDTKLTADTGSMAVAGTNLIVGVDSTGAVNNAWFNRAVLDVSGLADFSTNVTNINIGVGGTSAPTGSLLLSNTANTLITTGLKVGDTGGNNGNGTCTLTLGTGTNVIQADTIEIGKGKGSNPGVVKFVSQTTGSPGTVTIANKVGTGAANITVANVNGVGTAGGAIGTLDLRGHVATVDAGTLLISQTNAATSVASTNGTVQFDTGTFTVATLNMGPKTGASTGTATALLEVGGGDFTVNTAFTLGSQATAGTSVATLNLTGGTFTSDVAITRGAGAVTSTINLDGGTLDMTLDAIGTGANTITLNAKSGELKNLSEFNGGGTLTKSTTGILTLTGTNGYTGTTAVTEGTLALVNGSHASPITVSSGASLGFTLGSPTTSTSTFNVTAGTIKITGTPTLPSYTLITSSTGITGTPVLHTPIAGYVLKTVGNALVLENPYEVWAAANGATGGKTGDPDLDGIENLLEYAFGTDPTVSSTASISYDPSVVPGQPVLEEDGGIYYAVFGRRTDYLTAGLTYTVQFSNALSTWTATVTAPTFLATDGVIDAVRVPFLNFVPSDSGPQKPTFFRVQVSQ